MDLYGKMIKGLIITSSWNICKTRLSLFFLNTCLLHRDALDLFIRQKTESVRKVERLLSPLYTPKYKLKKQITLGLNVQIFYQFGIVLTRKSNLAPRFQSKYD